MKKDKKNPEEMSEKKRLQSLVWDGLFNALDPKPTDGKNANTEKKDKKAAKNKRDKDKSPEDSPTD